MHHIKHALSESSERVCVCYETEKGALIYAADG